MTSPGVTGLIPFACIDDDDDDDDDKMGISLEFHINLTHKNGNFFSFDIGAVVAFFCRMKYMNVCNIDVMYYNVLFKI